jgi:hypothetical protein
MKMVITDNRTTEPQRYNTPKAAEVAVIMIGDGQEIEQTERDIVLQLRPKYFVDRGILAPTNEHVNIINSTVITLFSGEAVEYLSADTVRRG